ncbi:MAG: glutamate-5-semialdehyde dehydrogenase, partial [Opitutaceae bacterium]|nr:glutamate-5-semialdehyde dehydrogenase [Cytophagales bacterium]
MIAGIDLTQIFTMARSASRELNMLNDQVINKILIALSKALLENSTYILSENAKDLARMDITDPKYDRLLLTQKRLEDISKDIINVSNLTSPLGKITDESVRPNGLSIKRITVPLGVIGIIYEARPNVTFDVFSLCFKSGNVAVLKGGSDAEFSNIAITSIIKEVLRHHQLNQNFVTLLPSDRSATEALLNAKEFVDVIIPRGSQGLINYVRDNSKVPVIETGAGIVHIYFDKTGNREKASAIINNSKTRRVSVCNALDCLLIHEDRVQDLHHLTGLLQNSNVIIFADDKSFAELKGKYPENLLFKATQEHFGTEFLDYKLAIKTVKNIDEALEHIAQYSSKHSETILSENQENIEKFQKSVDAAVVYANVSTAFTDGAQFGLGAEIGISTQKLHARGPMALAELCSYKWIVTGDGQIRQ